MKAASGGKVKEAKVSGDLQLVRFKLAGQDYGVGIMQVQSIDRIMPVTKVPRTPAFVEGVINIRDEVIPVVDLRKRFELETRPADNDTRIMIVEVEGKKVGIIVDAVSDVTTISESIVEPAPAMVIGIDSQYIKGVAKLENALLILLDLDKILNPEEIRQLKQIK
jgi:purine-binding chemotaxis protein CheW